MNKKSFRTIESIGHINLIKELTETEGDHYKSEAVLKGMGDDAAVLDETAERAGLISTESYLEGVHFDLVYTPLRYLGYKVITSTVSDIYAMNGKPEAVLINLALPNKLSVDMVKEIYDGIHTAGNDYQVQVVGGDTNASHQLLVLGITVYGRCRKKDIIYRSGANVGDAICVSGDLGGAIAGLRILMREKKQWEEKEGEHFQPDLSEYDYLIKRQLYPMARNDVIKILHSERIKPHSMIDISQGLVTDLHQLTEASEVGAYIYQSAIPIAPDTRKVADEMQEDVDTYALYGGEDFELLFTLDENEVEGLANKFNDFVVIGKITPKDEGVQMQTQEGNVVSFQQK